MTARIHVRPDAYFDSIVLMRVAAALGELPGIGTASLVMGTAANRGVLVEAGFPETDVAKAGPNDLVVALAGEESAMADAVALAEDLLSRPVETGAGSAAPLPARTLRQAGAADVAVVSTPGPYAAAEALKALRLGMHAFVFSDNVALEHEVALKRYAHEQGLLVMGPDCGTAIIGGVPFAFANTVRPGRIGLVGASGTGLQQVSCLIDAWGAGVSHVIGVGGRDLSREVGAISMLDALAALAGHDGTDVVVLVSKPPAPEVAETVLRAAAGIGKPVVAAFLGAEERTIGDVTVVATLDDAADVAFRRATGRPAPAADLAAAAPRVPSPRRTAVRALYAGGTFAYEASLLLAPVAGEVVRELPGYVPGGGAELPVTHLVLDLGDDAFTVGRPHPMIDPTARLELLAAAAADPSTAIVLLDVVLGHGAAADPAGDLAPAVARLASGPDAPTVIAFVVGTDGDHQDRAAQEHVLRAAGATVVRSSTHAAWLARTSLRAARYGEAS